MKVCTTLDNLTKLDSSYKSPSQEMY